MLTYLLKVFRRTPPSSRTINVLEDIDPDGFIWLDIEQSCYKLKKKKKKDM